MCGETAGFCLSALSTLPPQCQCHAPSRVSASACSPSAAQVGACVAHSERSGRGGRVHERVEARLSRYPFEKCSWFCTAPVGHNRAVAPGGLAPLSSKQTEELNLTQVVVGCANKYGVWMRGDVDAPDERPSLSASLYRGVLPPPNSLLTPPSATAVQPAPRPPQPSSDQSGASSCCAREPCRRRRRRAGARRRARRRRRRPSPPRRAQPLRRAPPAAAGEAARRQG
jgi:hypothetical protein